MKALRIDRAIIVALLLMGAMLAGFNAPLPEAHSAKRNVYKGTVVICYSPSKSSDEFAQYLQNRWVAQLPAAVTAAAPSIGKVKVVKERYPLTTCAGEVHIASTSEPWANNPKRPYDVYKYGENGVMWTSQLTMGDKVKLTDAQRKAWLVAALKVAIPR